MLRCTFTLVEDEDYCFKLLRCPNNKKITIKSCLLFLNSSSENVNDVIYLKEKKLEP